MPLNGDGVVAMNPAAISPQATREARDKFLAAAELRGAAVSRACASDRARRRRRGARRSTWRCSASADAPGLLLLIVGHARRRRLLRLGLPGGAACATTTFGARHRPHRRGRADRCMRSIRMAFRICAGSTRTTSTSTATFATSRAPLPVNAAYAEIHALLLPATWPPPPDSEAQLGAWVAAHGRGRVPGGRQRRPVRVSPTACSTAARGRRGATACCAPCCASMRRAAAPGLDRFPHRAGPRGHGEKIYAGGNVAADIARAKAWWGDDVTSYLRRHRRRRRR